MKRLVFLVLVLLLSVFTVPTYAEDPIVFSGPVAFTVGLTRVETVPPGVDVFKTTPMQVRGTMYMTGAGEQATMSIVGSLATGVEVVFDCPTGIQLVASGISSTQDGLTAVYFCKIYLAGTDSGEAWIKVIGIYSLEEIKVGNGTGISGMMQDTILTGVFRTKLTR